MKKIIEVWYTTLRGREMKDADNLNTAKRICRELAASCFTGICVDITFYKGDELIESKSKWYSFSNSKLKQI